MEPTSSSQALSNFIERQRATELAELRGLALQGRIPLPIAEINRALAQSLRGNNFIDELRLGSAEKNRLGVEIRSSQPIFDLPGLGWVARNLLGLNLSAGLLRLEFEIVQGTFAWPHSPFLVLRLPRGMAGTTLSQLLKSSGLLPRALGEWAQAVILEGQDLVLDLRWALQHAGWSCLGPALKTIEVQASGGILWIHLAVNVDSVGPASKASPSFKSQPSTGTKEPSPMKDILEKHLANGLTDLKGLRLSGQLPLREELLNELLAGFLSSKQASDKPVPAETASSSAGPDLGALLRQVKHAQVKVEQGVVMLHFDLSIDS